MKNFNQIKKFLLDIFFPKFCLGCNREGTYFCEDCQACLEISEDNFCLCQNPQRLTKAGKCKKCQHKELDGLYSAVPYQNKLVKKLIHQFKEEPFIKELAEPLTDLIITHFLLSKKSEETWKGKILIPLPLSKKEIKRRGFNPVEEITKNLSKILGIPYLTNCLIKTKEAFVIREKEKLKGKKILLVNDSYTTGMIMNKAAKSLKEVDVREVEGIVIARGSID